MASCSSSTAGSCFPEETQPGVDLILPDFEPIRDRLDDVVAIMLTHGHEDHIGAVPYLLRLRQDIPLIGTTLTLALIEAKLKEHRIAPLTMAVEAGGREKLGPFDLEFVAVNHSIPDALAVMIRTALVPFFTPVTSRWTSFPSMDDSPIFARLPGSAKRGLTCSWWTPRTQMFPASPRAKRTLGLCWIRLFTAPLGESLLQALPPTFTAFSRSLTRLRKTIVWCSGGPLDGAQHGYRPGAWLFDCSRGASGGRKESRRASR
jgi:hypothetical protein